MTARIVYPDSEGQILLDAPYRVLRTTQAWACPLCLSLDGP